MKNNLIRNIALFSASVAFASTGLAQAAVTGAANAATRANVPAVSAGAASSANAAARTPVLPSGAANSAQAGVNVSPGVNANATTNASANGQANGLAVASVASNQASTTVDMTGTVRTIRETDFAARGSLTADVEGRLDASVKQVESLEARARASGEKSRAEFNKALKEVRKQEKEVRSSLRAAAKASDEKWGKTQSELAKDYSAYAEAVAHAEAAASAQR